MLLVIDNSSLYFNDLVRCLDGINAKHEVKRYDRLDSCDPNNYDGIILSGRMDNIRSINVANIGLVKFAYENGKPLLGICYGAEIIALALNGSLRRLSNRITGDRIINVKSDNPLTDKKALKVFECHGYYIARLPQGFSCIADSSDCRYEIIGHDTKQIFGTQFHPEMSKEGLEILDNFAKLTKH